MWVILDEQGNSLSFFIQQAHWYDRQLKKIVYQQDISGWAQFIPSLIPILTPVEFGNTANPGFATIMRLYPQENLVNCNG